MQFIFSSYRPEGRQLSVAPSGNSYYRFNYQFGDEGDAPGAQFFRIETLVDSHIKTHYHDEPQFQMYISPELVLSGKPLGEPTLQYLDAYRAYGPIDAPRGSVFFTLRFTRPAGTYFMPEARDKLPEGRGRRRQLISPVRVPDGTSMVHELMRESDGVAAELFTIGPMDVLPQPRTSSEALLVLDGQLRSDAGGPEYDQYAAAIPVPGAPEPEGSLRGGSDGAVVLRMDYGQEARVQLVN